MSIVVFAIVYIIFMFKLSVIYKPMIEKRDTTALLNKKLNCKKVITPCASDRDCNLICENDRFECKKQTCAPTKEVNVKKRETHKNISCNLKHGIIPVEELLPGGGIILRCKSLYYELWTNDDTQVPGACHNGRLETNVLLRPPALEDCVCPENYTVIELKNYKHSLPEQVAIPKCVPTAFKHLYLA
ncbi:MAG: hypothetical protein ACRYGG_20280 [Janthinobacterium lividum]